MDIGDWLRSLGLERYEAVFRENEIDETVLPNLTAEDLKDLGVSIVGHRRKLLDAIASPHPNGGVKAPYPDAAPTATAPSITPEDRAERRQLTVMFCDLVGSTALSAQLDPEDLRAIIGSYHRCCAEVINRSGGFVAKYMGDGVLAYFGYPQAQEEDAERAVRAGLALVEAVPNGHGRAALQVRIGIATGLVVVGDLLGEGAAQEQAVVGETPNLAARLQALAEPGAVVIAASTRRLTRGLFEYRDLGTIALKGLGENVPAWQVLGLGSAEGRFEALRTTTTPLVGRDEEIDLLMRRWEQAKRGDGQVVLISGEPGIGKSRIAQTIVERISGQSHTRLRYFCSPHHQDSALYPSITQLERAAGFRRDDSPEQRLEKLEVVLAHGANDLTEAVPLMADLLSIPIGNRYPPLILTPQKRKERTLHAQLAQVEGLAARQPVLMVFEDIHWSDPTTRESLDLLVDRVSMLPVLAIFTFRPEFTPPWIGRPHVTLLTLSRLPPRQRAEMIVHVTGGKVLPREIADQIVDRTDGVPLFIEELTKSVVESGIVTAAGDHYAVAGPVAPLAIPTSLHTSLLARLDRLAPTREVAQIGAALGRSFTHEVIAAVAGMPDHKLSDALKQLVRAELILQRGTPPDCEYTFKHALVQDAAYDTLLRNRRQHIHAHIAAILETQFPEMAEVHPGVLARHFAEAALLEKAIGYWLKAGQQALTRSAMIEAEAQLKKGLELVVRLPDNLDHQQNELNLQIAYGRALRATRGFAAPEVSAAFTRARWLCEQLDQPSQLAMVMSGQWSNCLSRGDILLSYQLANELLDHGETRNDPSLRLAGYRCSTVSCFHLGDLGRAREHAERAIALCDPAHPPLVPLAYLYRSLLHLGYLDQACSRRDELLEQARRGTQSHTLATAITLLCDKYLERDPATLLQRADALMALGFRHDFPFFAAGGTVFRGWCLSALGQPGEGLRVLTEGIAHYRATGALQNVPLFLTMLAQAFGRAGRAAEGLSHLDQAEQVLNTTQERWAEVELRHVRGELLVAVGEHAAAKHSLLLAVSVASQQKAKLLELLATMSLARLLRDRGKPGEGHDLLESIYGLFIEGFDTPILKEAAILLNSLQQR
jgi:class 3 adenylate cyclase/predicted ATPase